MTIYCDNCAREIEDEVIHISTDEGEFTFCRRCHDEEIVEAVRE